MRPLRAIPSALAVLLLPALAAAGVIQATVTAAPNSGDPDQAAWIYTMDVTWDTGTPYGLSHFNLYLDPADFGCGCQEIASSLSWGETVGVTAGEPGGCSLPFTAELNCSGDPSIGLDGIVLKFEPVEEGCEAGPTGQVTVTFSSPYPPGDIAEPNTFLTDKYGQLVGTGSLTGVFPALACDPVSADALCWGDVKARYGR